MKPQSWLELVLGIAVLMLFTVACALLIIAAVKA